MSSGIAISEKCMEHFNALQKRTYSAVVLKIDKEMTEVSVDTTLPPSAGDPETEWKDFLKAIPEDDCRFILFDFSWKETPTVTKSKVIMINWSPENSPVRAKMIYASSREAVSNQMPVQKSIQATEIDEVLYNTVKDAVVKNK